jgi:hypothetical protein
LTVRPELSSSNNIVELSQLALRLKLLEIDIVLGLWLPYSIDVHMGGNTDSEHILRTEGKSVNLHVGQVPLLDEWKELLPVASLVTLLVRLSLVSKLG